jgi:hypothetical protein
MATSAKNQHSLNESGSSLIELLIAAAIVSASIVAGKAALEQEGRALRGTTAGFDVLALEGVIKEALREPLKRAYHSERPCVDVESLVVAKLGTEAGGYEFVSENSSVSYLTDLQKTALRTCSKECVVVVPKRKAEKFAVVVKFAAAALDVAKNERQVCDVALIKENQFASAVYYQLLPSKDGRNLMEIKGKQSHLEIANSGSGTAAAGRGTQYHVPEFWVRHQKAFPLPTFPADDGPRWSESQLPFQRVAKTRFMGRGSITDVYVVPKSCTADVTKINSADPSLYPDCHPCLKNYADCTGR